MAKAKVGGGGTFRKWSDHDAGDAVDGTYLGLREGKYGLLVDLDTPDGMVTYPVPALLLRQLSRIRVASSVTIQYKGKHTSGRGDGKTFHDFDTFADAETSSPRHPGRDGGGRHGQGRPLLKGHPHG